MFILGWMLSITGGFGAFISDTKEGLGLSLLSLFIGLVILFRDLSDFGGVGDFDFDDFD